MSFFDPDEGDRRKADGIERAATGRSKWWTGPATNEAKRMLPFLPAKFTTDDVWLWLKYRGLPAPPEPRAMGAVMSRLVRQGYIRKVDDFWQSKRPVAHRNPKQVWEWTGQMPPRWIMRFRFMPRPP